jgi:hypothetical protein
MFAAARSRGGLSTSGNNPAAALGTGFVVAVGSVDV